MSSGQPLTGWRRALVLLSLITCWYSSSISIVFANKHLLSARSFRYPFFMTAFNNGVVCLIAWLVTRLPSFRQPPLSWRVTLRVVVPIGLCTALDISFSNWSLSMMSVSFHTILKGTIPAFVLIVGWLLKLERASALTACSVALVCVGVGMASAAEVQFSGMGLVLGLISASMGGTRWALTQLLMKAPANTRPSKGAAAADRRGGKDGEGHDSDCGSSDGGKGGGWSEEGHEGVQKQISRHANPLGSMLLISPVTASCALVLALLLEVFDTPFVSHAANHTALLDSEWVHSAAMVTQLLGFLVVIALLVFILLLAEFAIVNLTSSLTLSILGIVKELLTIALAGGIRGERLTVINLAGFGICSFGVLLYHLIKQRKEVVACLRAAFRYVGCCGSRGDKFVQMIEELDAHAHSEATTATAAAAGIATATRDADLGPDGASIAGPSRSCCKQGTPWPAPTHAAGASPGASSMGTELTRVPQGFKVCLALHEHDDMYMYK
jgi:solute carrier family 35 protein C2